jgi:DNA polymerase III subunit beta
MSKIVFNREHLLHRLKKAIQFIPKKAILGAHEQFLFILKDGKMSITATDGEKQATLFATATKSDGDASFCVPGLLIFKTLGLLLEDEVTFTCKDERVELKAGKSKYKMPSIKVSEYPIMPAIDSPFEASFLGVDFNSAVETARKFTDSQSTIAAHQGICFRMGENNSINVYGFKGFEICKVVSPPRSINKWEDIVIPAQVINAMLKCVNDSDIVDITHNKDRVEIRTPEMTIMACAFNMKYPDVEMFFNKKPKEYIELNTVQTLTALQRVALYSKEEEPKAMVDIKTNSVTIKASNDAYNRDSEEVIDVVSESECIFYANVHFLINALEAFKCDSFYLFPPDAEKRMPIFIEPSSALKVNDKFFIISPMTAN